MTPREIAESTIDVVYRDEDPYWSGERLFSVFLNDGGVDYGDVIDLIVTAIEVDRVSRDGLDFVRRYGPPMTDGELARVAEAVPYSSIPDALGEIIYSVTEGG